MPVLTTFLADCCAVEEDGSEVDSGDSDADVNELMTIGDAMHGTWSASGEGDVSYLPRRRLLVALEYTNHIIIVMYA